jgi:hypothetical protein
MTAFTNSSHTDPNSTATRLTFKIAIHSQLTTALPRPTWLMSHLGAFDEPKLTVAPEKDGQRPLWDGLSDSRKGG